MTTQRGIILRDTDALVSVSTGEHATPYDVAQHDDRIWATFRLMEDYRSHGLMTKEEIVRRLKRVVLNDREIECA